MGKITMVASSRDGVGKSTTSVFLADALSEMGKRVLIIELDSGFRSLDIISGVYGNTVYDILDVLSGRCDPDQAIVHAPRGNVFVLPAPYRNEPIQGNQFIRLCTILGEEYDHVLIDTASLTGTTIAASAVSMNALLVATPDPLCVRDSRILFDRLCDLSVKNTRLILNRITPQRVASGIVPSLDYCIDNIGAQLIGAVLENDEIALRACSGKPLDKKSQNAEIYRRIAKRMYGEELPLVIQ